MLILIINFNVEFQEEKQKVVGVDTSNSDLFQIGTSSIVPNDNKFVINTSGQVGIGTSSPDFLLDVAGTVGIDSYIYHNGDTIQELGSKVMKL